MNLQDVSLATGELRWSCQLGQLGFTRHHQAPSPDVSTGKDPRASSVHSSWNSFTLGLSIHDSRNGERRAVGPGPFGAGGADRFGGWRCWPLCPP